MSDEVSDTQARSWVAEIVRAYEVATSDSTMGLHNHIAAARRPCLFTTTAQEEQIDRVNHAIEEWE